MLRLVGGVIGAQVGACNGNKLKAEQLRILLAILVLGMSAKTVLDLTQEPFDHDSIDVFTPIGTEHFQPHAAAVAQ